MSGLPFDGALLGDATAAPYDATELDAFLYYLGGFVAPTILDELEVTTSASNGTVTVKSGAGICNTTYYVNDSTVDVAITSAVNNRIDRIVLRYVAASFNTRITKIVGAEAANPSPPALTAGDVPLAWIWIPAGYNAATTLISVNDIHDDRIFRDNATSAVNDSRKNLMPNSEFIAYSGAALGTEAPENWYVYGVPTTIGNGALLNSQPRGLSVNITANAGAGMRTNVRVPSGVTLDGIHTIKGLINITSGVVRITVGTTVKDFYRTGVDQEFIIRYNVGSNEIPIIIEANAAASDFNVGQIMIVQGYVPGNFRPKHETIMLDYEVADANWTATAKSTGLTNIDLAATFGNIISRYIRGLIIRMQGNDSGSAANVCGIELYHSSNTSNVISRLRLDRLVNDRVSSIVGFVSVDRPPNNSFTIGVTATGVGTLDATIVIIGIIT